MKKIMIIGSLLTFLFGCREYHYYRYNPVVANLLDGRLMVSVEGTYGQNYEKKGKRMADWSFPYRVHLDFRLPVKSAVYRIKIKDIILEGVESGKIHHIGKVFEDSVIIDEESDEKSAFFSIGDLAEGIYLYEDYRLKLDVEFFEAEAKNKIEHIDVLLKTVYKKGARSDWFDEKMSP